MLYVNSHSNSLHMNECVTFGGSVWSTVSVRSYRRKQLYHCLPWMSSSPYPHKIYTDLLLAKGFGYPLYYPEPYRNAVRRGWSGVSIGDVGAINNDGGFDFRFNVIKKPDDPTSNELDMRRGAVGHRETTSVANGLPLHAELSFYNPPPAFDPIVLEEWEIRYNDNDCHPGKVIGRYITHTLSIDGEISLAQIP